MDCTKNVDALKLIREGLSQEQRRKDAPNPAHAQVNERTPAHVMAFAKTYAQWLQYYKEDNTVSGNWERFFDSDVSVLLSIAAIEPIELYAVQVQETFEFLNDLNNKTKDPELKEHLGNLFCILVSLAKQIDLLMLALPKEIKLKSVLTNLIQSRLAPDLQKLITYHLQGKSLSLITDVVPQEDMFIFGKPVATFSKIINTEGLSINWVTDGSATWNAYLGTISNTSSIYGTGPTVFDKVNHIATHNLFTSIFDQFLKVYTRIVKSANNELQQTLGDWPSHKPHFALFLSFLLLNEYARKETNTLTARHLDYYYRDILHLKEKPASPSKAHVLLELAKNKTSLELKEQTPFNAKKDDLNKDVIFANDQTFVANQGKVSELRTVYMHVNETNETLTDMDKRFFASPVANSEDGIGGALLSEDQSWHPFFSKIYDGDVLDTINMPTALIGFAVSSHYLLMAEGTRTITLNFTIDPSTITLNQDFGPHVTCYLSKADGWIEKPPVHFKLLSSTQLQVQISVDGNDPAITPHDVKIHGYHFDTTLPTLIIALRQDTTSYIYSTFEHLVISSVEVIANVAGLRTLAVNNDFGAVDTSKPFLPFGSAPISGSSFVFGSKELFQKESSLSTPVKLNIAWQVVGVKYATVPASAPQVSIKYLANGNWISLGPFTLFSGGESDVLSFANFNNSILVAPDYGENEILNPGSAYGYIKVTLEDHFGQEEYLNALRDYLILKATVGTTAAAPTPPQIPIAIGFSIDYTSIQTIDVSSGNEVAFNDRKARFFHLAPFGESEQHAYLTPLAKHLVYLFPQFDFYRNAQPNESVAEFYIGVKDLVPPQNLALLFQVSDGTADPLTQKPEKGQHIHWSFLQNNEWAPFESNEIVDATTELTKSGIVTLSVPREATSTNTIFPAGYHWIRLAVAEKTEAVCRLLQVAAQAVLTTFKDQDNDPNFPAKIVAGGTISKLVNPDSGVKKVTQPFDSFDGKGAETPDDFFKRISERLRHKDRAITLWDYEHLVLEEFPKIYKVKCLNHTEYEPTDDSLGTYRELAPGHVTIVTIPNQDNMKVRNTLRPYTSLGTLLDIESFLKSKLSCHVKLHVRNPQFEEVRTEFGVHFHEGFDESYYKVKLQEEITRFLSPWAFPGGGSPSFGGKIYKSVLINFVEERSYVDYITEFKLKHKPGDAVIFSGDLNEVIASTAVSILVSVPADQHIIMPIDEEEAEVTNESCSCAS